jgi:hypothetical protein
MACRILAVLSAGSATSRDLNDDGILGDARTWLARRPRPAPGRLHSAS